MAEHKRISRDNTEESAEKRQTRKKIQQPLHDQVKAADEGLVDFLEPSLEKQAALLASAHSDEQRANLIAHWQRSYGNSYVQRLLSSRAVQAKLTVNPPDDIYEREADRVANEVTQTPASEVQRQEEEEELQMKPASEIQRQEEEEELQMKPASEIQRQEEEEEELQMKPASEIQRQEEEEEELQMKPASEIQRQEEEEEELQMKPASEIQRQEEEEELQMKPASEIQRQPMEEEEEMIQPKASEIQRQGEEEEEELQAKTSGSQTPAVSEDLERRIDTARGSGQALDERIRSSLEPQFGRDFSQVRIHTDAEANKLSRQLGAEAFTAGEDVFFSEGAYQPDSESGKGLIAHELTHVVQQEGGTTAQVRQKAVEQSRSESTNIVQRVPGDTIVGWNTNSISAANGFISHQVGWNSSTGNLTDLNHIRTREQVSWPACTWPVLEPGYAAPGQHHGMGTTAGTQGYNLDTHQASQPFFDITPLRDRKNAQYLAKGAQSAPFVMNQVYQYTTDGGTTWHDIPGSQYTLTRILRRKGLRGKRYVYTLTKQGVTDGGANITTSVTVKI